MAYDILLSAVKYFAVLFIPFKICVYVGPMLINQ